MKIAFYEYERLLESGRQLP